MVHGLNPGNHQEIPYFYSFNMVKITSIPAFCQARRAGGHPSQAAALQEPCLGQTWSQGGTLWSDLDADFFARKV